MINPQSLDISSLPSVSLQNRKDLPTTPSIYFAIDSLGTVQYIGRSVNPRNRWVNHHRANQLEDNCRIAWLDCDASLLNEVEEALISFFKPPLNGAFVKQQKTWASGIKITKTIETEAEGLGKKIWQERRLSYKTLKQLCKEAEVTTTHWYSIEREEVDSLPIETLQRIEKALGINLEVNFEVNFDD